MGVFDDISGGIDNDGRDGDEFDHDNAGDEFDDDRDGDGRDDRQNDDDDQQRQPTDQQRRKRQRPGSQRRAQNEVRNLRQQLDQLTQLVQQAGLAVNVGGRNSSRSNGNGGQRQGNGGGDQGQPIDVDAITRQIEERVRSEVEGKANARVIRSEARSALREAGFRGDASRGVRMLDLDNIDPDDSDALLDAIDELKEESPELFGRVRRSRATRDRDDDSDDDYRSRDSRRSARSREGMSRNRESGRVSEQDGLAANLSRLVGGQRRDR